MGKKKDIEKNLVPSVEAFDVIFEKLRIEDGDTVVLKCQQPLTEEWWASITRWIR